jgi:hypothetical protein
LIRIYQVDGISHPMIDTPITVNSVVGAQRFHRNRRKRPLGLDPGAARIFQAAEQLAAASPVIAARNGLKLRSWPSPDSKPIEPILQDLARRLEGINNAFARGDSMDEQTFVLSFDEAPIGDANRYASDLRSDLLDAAPAANITQARQNPYTQDFGATLVLVLAAPSIVAVAKSLGDWLMRHNRVSVTIKTSQGQVVMQNVTANDARQLAEVMLGHK